MEQVDKDINVRSKDCETCKHYKLACELFSEICKYEPTTQTETQNSNLTLEKDECAKEYEELGLKELKELIEADHKTEPQTIRCPKCGRTDYIRDMEKDMGIKGSHYKYKCINCNTYIKDEPTISKMEQVDKDINVRSKDEPQTDCAWK